MHVGTKMNGLESEVKRSRSWLHQMCLKRQRACVIAASSLLSLMMSIHSCSHHVRQLQYLWEPKSFVWLLLKRPCFNLSGKCWPSFVSICHTCMHHAAVAVLTGICLPVISYLLPVSSLMWCPNNCCRIIICYLKLESHIVKFAWFLRCWLLAWVLSLQASRHLIWLIVSML